jgi:hypothetical protein
MCRDYNAVRNTLDMFASRVLNALINVDARNPRCDRTFRSDRITVANEPFANGLNYTTVNNHVPFQLPLKSEVKNVCQDDIDRIYTSLRSSSQIKLKHRYTHILSMDLFKQETWAFDLGQIGFNLLDISSTPSLKNQVLQWYEELPARKVRQRQLAHPFYGSTGGML